MDNNRIIKNPLKDNTHTTVISSRETKALNSIDIYSVEKSSPKDMICKIRFQTGTIQELGVNGVSIEDLIVICIDRLESFQAGPLGNRENQMAITKLEEALMWLNKRTADRKMRAVEGTYRP